MVDCPTLASVWSTQERVLASQSNFRIMQLHGSLQDLRQGDDTVILYLQKAKGLFDKLAIAGRPISLTDFNLYVFLGLCGEFGDLVTSLSTKAEPLTYSELHSHLSTYEFLHGSSLQSIQAIAPFLPTPSHPPSAYVAQRAFTGFNDSGSSSHQGKGRRGGWKGNSRNNYNKYPVQPYHGNSGSSSWQNTRSYNNSRNKEGNTSGLGRLDANFTTISNTLHNNALSLCIMGIKPRPTSPLVMLQQQILSLGSPIQVQINMLL